MTFSEVLRDARKVLFLLMAEFGWFFSGKLTCSSDQCADDEIMIMQSNCHLPSKSESGDSIQIWGYSS